jgi:CheY-like chemotaxis protein
MATVLVIDDDEANRSLMSALLATEHRLLIAETGLEGLSLMGREKPDVVVTDLAMPGMNGFRVLEIIRADERFAGLPVIAVTAHVSAGSDEELLAAGFDGVLLKPFDIHTFIETVSRLAAGRPMRPDSPDEDRVG